MKILVKKQKNASDLPMPAYMTEGAAGMDLRASVEEDKILNPGSFDLIPTGISISLPQGYEAQIRPRSGLALKYGVTLVNSPGTVDSDYRGEINVILINFGHNPFTVKRGDRIAQMVINKVEIVEIIEVEELDSSERNDGGFGSTGL